MASTTLTTSSSSPQRSAPPRPPANVLLGHVCILDFGEGKQYFVHAVTSGPRHSVKLGQKGNVKTSGLVGLPYGCVVEVKDGRLVRAEGDEMLPTLEILTSTTSSAGKGGELQEGVVVSADGTARKNDNRDLVDDNASQACTQEDVRRMREEGRTGAQIVERLVSSSATFEGKTTFAKAKYIKRKVREDEEERSNNSPPR